MNFPPGSCNSEPCNFNSVTQKANFKLGHTLHHEEFARNFVPLKFHIAFKLNRNEVSVKSNIFEVFPLNFHF